MDPHVHCGRLQESIHEMNQAHWIERVEHIQTNGAREKVPQRLIRERGN